MGLRVAVVSTPIFQLGPQGTYGYSGLEHLAWLQAKGLAELGHEVSLVAPDGSVCPGVQIVPCGPAGQVDEATAYSRYWQHLLTVDAVVDNSWMKHTYILKMEGRLQAPVLGVMHAPVNTMYQTLPNLEKPCFVCISDDQKDHFEALFGRPARRAYNGIDPLYYTSTGVPRTDRFLFLARFSSIKGADIAIEACLEAGVGLDLIGDTTITGEPDYLQHCLRLAQQTSLNWNPSRGKQIRVYGGVSRGETVHWHSQAHCMIHPNQRFREPMGLSPCESMLCQTPVIGWRYGALKETVKEGVSGWLVSTKDELVQTIQKAARGISPEMRKAAREWALRFSVQNMVIQYDNLIREAVETGGW